MTQEELDEELKQRGMTQEEYDKIMDDWEKQGYEDWEDECAEKERMLLKRGC